MLSDVNGDADAGRFVVTVDGEEAELLYGKRAGSLFALRYRTASWNSGDCACSPCRLFPAKHSHCSDSRHERPRLATNCSAIQGCMLIGRTPNLC